jgi:hypothetical protein
LSHLIALRASLRRQQGVDHGTRRQAGHLIKGHEVGGVAFKANALGIDPSALAGIFNTRLRANRQGQALNFYQQARHALNAAFAHRQRQIGQLGALSIDIVLKIGLAQGGLL